MRAGRTVGGALLSVGLVCALTWAGCSDEECLDCLGSEPCPSFLGTYVAQQQGSLDSCDTYYLHEGQTVIQVVSQDGNNLELEKQGNWYKGEICNTTDRSPPRSFSFDVYHDVGDPGGDYNVRLLIVGTFREGMDGGPPAIRGTLIILLTKEDDSGEDCSLTGSFEGEMVQ